MKVIITNKYQIQFLCTIFCQTFFILQQYLVLVELNTAILNKNIYFNLNKLNIQDVGVAAQNSYIRYFPFFRKTSKQEYIRNKLWVVSTRHVHNRRFFTIHVTCLLETSGNIQIIMFEIYLKLKNITILRAKWNESCERSGGVGL